MRIFSCSSDGQKSYCRKTFYQQIHFISQQFTWKVGRQCISLQMPNMDLILTWFILSLPRPGDPLQWWALISQRPLHMETRFIPMLQSSWCIYQTIFLILSHINRCVKTAFSSAAPYCAIKKRRKKVKTQTMLLKSLSPTSAKVRFSIL